MQSHSRLRSGDCSDYLADTKGTYTLRYYTHEAQERKVNTHPMCTELPAYDVSADDVMDIYLAERNLDSELARKNGWFPTSCAGDGYDRIVIPAVTHKAGHVYWQARDVSGKAFIRYQSPKGPRHEALIKVIPYDKPYQNGAVIVEGPMDALAAAGEGYTGFALMGMKPSKATLMHLALLLEDDSPIDSLVLLDRGELSNAIAVSTFLCSQGYPAKVAELPEKDLAQCLPEVRRRFLSQRFRSLFK